MATDPARLAFRSRVIIHHGQRVRVALQDGNGPCPLLALANVLALRGEVPIAPRPGADPADAVTATDVINALAGYALERLAARAAGSSATQQGATDAATTDVLACLPRLTEGMDINVRFTAPDAYEATRELAVFDALGVRLLHGWVADAGADGPMVPALLHRFAYNALVTHLIGGGGGGGGGGGATGESDAHEAELRAAVQEHGAAAREWLADTGSQLTYSGLIALRQTVRAGELAVLFRGGHYAVVTREDGGPLMLLVTDEAMALGGGGVAWETLEDTDGAGTRFLPAFPPQPVSQSAAVPAAAGGAAASPPPPPRRVVHAVPVADAPHRAAAGASGGARQRPRPAGKKKEDGCFDCVVA